MYKVLFSCTVYSSGVQALFTIRRHIQVHKTSLRCVKLLLDVSGVKSLVEVNVVYAYEAFFVQVYKAYFLLVFVVR